MSVEESLIVLYTLVCIYRRGSSLPSSLQAHAVRLFPDHPIILFTLITLIPCIHTLNV